MDLYYHIFKVYKGLLVKKHVRNIQVFTIPEVPSEHYFSVGPIVGKIEAPGRDIDGSIVYLAEALGDINGLKDFINEFSNSEKIKLMEQLPCSVISKAAGSEFSIKLQKKGNFIKSNLTLIYSDSITREVGKRAFFMKGDINLQVHGMSFPLVRMNALKKSALLKVALSNIPGLIEQ